MALRRDLSPHSRRANTRLTLVLVIVVVLALNPLAIVLLKRCTSWGWCLPDGTRSRSLLSSPRYAVLIIEPFKLSDFICNGSCAVEQTETAESLRIGTQAAEKTLQWALNNDLCKMYVKVAEEGCFREGDGQIHSSWCSLLELPRLDAFCGGIDGVFIVNVSAGYALPHASLPLAALQDRNNTGIFFDGISGAQFVKMDKNRGCNLFASASRKALRSPLLQFWEEHPWMGKRRDFSGAFSPMNYNSYLKHKTSVQPILRFWSQNHCHPGARWEHPSPVRFTQLAHARNQSLKLQARVARDPLRRPCAVVFYVLEGEEKREKKFFKLLSALGTALRKAKAAAPQCDVVVAAAPLESWNSEVRARALNATVEKTSGVEFRTPETVQQEDFSSRALRIMRKGQNCCGWTEYQKLGAWNLVEYKSVLVLDSDVRLDADLDEVFSNEEYDFLATPDPVCALNGGFLWLRPSRTVFEEMRQAVRDFEYSFKSGWNNSGTLLPKLPLFEVSGPFRRIRRNTMPYAIAEETNQGFLFWFFFIRPQTGGQQRRAGMLDQCVYNFNMQRGAIRYLCSETAKGDRFTVRACHKGCSRHGNIYSLSALKFDPELAYT